MARYRGFLGGSRVIRRRVAGTALAAATMAAMAASQAPGAEVDHHADDPGKERPDEAQPDRAPGDDSYHTELPPLESPAPPRTSPGPSESGIPASVLAAYKMAARSLGASDPACGLRWELLAAIGKVESGQARGGAVDKEGNTLKPILGPVLNGSGYARIADTDGGRFDGDKRFDRAVGPMQFIPSTWSRWSADGNGDGSRDPGNIQDAALAAAGYLCAGERDLGTKTGLHRSVLSYNDSGAYLHTVLAWYGFYRNGTHEIPDGTGPLPDSPGAGVTDGSGKGKGSHGGSGSHKPGKGDGGKGHGGGNGGDDSPAPDPHAPTALKPVLAGPLTAYTGENFEQRPRVRAVDKSGKAVDGVRVKFTIKGGTDARFPGGKTGATAPTGADGTASAPVVDAGERAGEFTVTATAVGRDLSGAKMKATVNPKYTFARTPEGPLKAPVDSEFTEIKVKLEHEGKAAAGVPVTAALVGDGGEENTEGPYFKDLFGNKVRTRSGLSTGSGGVFGEKGLLKLPAVHTDGHTGTFTLRLTTQDGSAYDIPLKVTGK